MTKEQSIQLVKGVLAAEQGKKARIFKNGIEAYGVEEVEMLQLLSNTIKAAQVIGDEETEFEMVFYASLIIEDFCEEFAVAA